MRSPQVFDQYGPTIAAVARDLVIWCAWNKAREAQLNVKQFGEMFGYSKGFLFKRVNAEQAAWLKLKEFGPEFKDVIGYTLARLSIEKMNFPKAAQYIAEDEKGTKTQYKMLGVISEVTTQTTRRGTSYFFRLSRTFLNNCQGGRYRSFDLAEYLNLKLTSGNAWSAGRKMYLHLVWKRGAWDQAPHGKKKLHELAQYDELLAVAGYTRSNPTRQAHELHELLKSVAAAPGIAMLPDVKLIYETGAYEVSFSKYKEPAAHKVV
jgi:hypothetical protein